MTNQDHQVSPDLDHCLIQLAEILQKVGVEDLTITDTYQHHTINMEHTQANAEQVAVFCSAIGQLYTSLTAHA